MDKNCISFSIDGESLVQKENRLGKKEDFNKVYRYGKSSANHQFVVYVMRQPAVDHFRLGVSVSKKLGNAVVRNRIKRLVKEIVRHHGPSIAPKHDFIVIARKPVADMDYAEMEKSLLHVFRRASLLRKIHS
jgi:ribonuclease P protein component